MIGLGRADASRNDLRYGGPSADNERCSLEAQG